MNAGSFPGCPPVRSAWYDRSRTVLRTPSAATTRSHSPVRSPVLVRAVTVAGSPPRPPGPAAASPAIPPPATSAVSLSAIALLHIASACQLSPGEHGVLRRHRTTWCWQSARVSEQTGPELLRRLAEMFLRLAEADRCLPRSF